MLRKSVVPLAIVLCTATVAPSAFASVNVSLRTFYMNRDFDGITTDREAFTQAVRVDMEHNFVDAFKIGGSIFANAKLAEDGDSQFTGLLNEESEGYAKLGQIYAEYNFNQQFFVKAGRWVVDTPLFNDSDSRATPSSSQAIKLSGAFTMGNVYTLYTDRSSIKVDNDFNRYEDTTDAGTIDEKTNEYGVFLIGGDMAFDNGLSLATALGDANDYSTQFYFNAGYKINDAISINGVQYIGEGDGTNSAFDASMTNIYGSYTVSDFTFTGSFQTVYGDSGYNYSWGGDDDSGLQVMNSVQILDFNNEDEDSFQLRFDYNVSQLPSFQIMARHTMGEYTSAFGAGDVDESETDFEMRYTLQSGWLEGVKLRLRYAHVEMDEFDDIDEIRLIVNYAFPQIW